MSTLPAAASPEFRSLAATVGETVSDPPTLAQQVLVCRLARGITQSALAAAAGLNRAATVADIESGRGDGRNPKADKLQALADALNVTICFFPSRGP